MSVNSNEITVEDSTPTFPKVITIVSTGAATTGVKGVKGEAEADYREGYVNLTPANLGLMMIEINEPSGTLPESYVRLLTNNTMNLIGYEVGQGKSYAFRLHSWTGENWTYGAVSEDYKTTYTIVLNTTTGAYQYSSSQSGTEEEIEEHVSDSAIHVSDEDRENWNNKVSCAIDGEILEFIR